MSGVGTPQCRVGPRCPLCSRAIDNPNRPKYDLNYYLALASRIHDLGAHFLGGSRFAAVTLLSLRSFSLLCTRLVRCRLLLVLRQSLARLVAGPVRQFLRGRRGGLVGLGGDRLLGARGERRERQ